VHILTSYSICGVQRLTVAQSTDYTMLGASMSENGNREGFQNVVFL